ncbi:cytochrome d ubiquinol oxidase subunit II [Bradyrhizobium vignae]|uniref:cytochrome d ubiquinol oxidase subunit II n=1 Tax=Bradyrhizobium vignae TaxID=1549949 RepID=UPI00100C3594|nr:cytochrome d ubiquinol oxidase subunit II [Bradyrhizobium vignae]RXG86209.1 cytochrome d ubiquinol oxidase subunit II [Bradyrhizobium vignae]
MVLFWVTLLAVSILIYLLLDGFDLGVGMLFGFAGNQGDRDTMLSSVAPVWDGNETWLVVAGVILWGAFPLAYATLLSAFYLPVVIMLLGLILRGVAFEFRHRAAQRFRWIWDVSFVAGSLAASFMQGVTVGALVEGLKFTGGVYAGGPLGWLSPFSVLCGIGLCLGYALLGAAWLVQKCHSGVRDRARRQIPVLALAVLAFLIVVFAHALISNLPIMHRWLERPYLFVFPAIGAVAAAVLASSILHRNDRWPLFAVAIIFSAAFGTLALSFWPYMIPFAITVDEAAAPRACLAFMFWGEGLFIFPLMLVYVAIGYRVFRGKIESLPEHY